MSTESLRTPAASLAAFLLVAMPVAASTATKADPTGATSDPAMPSMLRLALARSQATDVAAVYHLDSAGRGANPRHRFELIFTPRGARIDGPAGGFALRLDRFGRGDGRPVRREVPHIDGAWVEYDRGAGLTEWFVNLPRGVEQGWTVTERPAGGGPLVLELDTARPPEEGDDGRLAWSGLVYHRLVALDAAGRELPATWTRDGARLRIEVADRGAAYPLLIDPWVQLIKLTAADARWFGTAVALEGGTALVGATGTTVGDNLIQGAAYVFTRSGGMWSQQAKLVADDGAADDRFGNAVALAGDTALIAAQSAEVGGNAHQGAVYVFTREGEVWSQQDKLTAADGGVNDFFGTAVAVSGDSALVGVPFDGVNGSGILGSAYVFTRSDGLWNQQDKLTVEGGAGFGFSVDLEGDTALVGARQVTLPGGIGQGAAYVFTRSDGVWSQQAMLFADDGATDDRLGSSVALSGDTALLGAVFADVGDNADQGAAYVFTRSDGAWSQQAKLAAADGAPGDQFGVSVALEGDTALVGAWKADEGDVTDHGAAYVFTRSDGAWSQRAKLASDDGGVTDEFGFSVAFADGSALVGTGPFGGAAYVFVPPLASVALAVDSSVLDSDGNGIFEPGEQVEVAPSWRNDGDVTLIVSGDAASFTGPAGATHDVVLANADYGTLVPGASASCRDTEMCYALEVNDPAARPALHWDATFDETLTDPGGSMRTWTLHIGDSFTDVPRGSLFYSWIETLLHSGVTGGCRDTKYCPAGTSTRAQMPAFVLRALLGPEFTPEPCVEGDERFDDVPAGHLFCPWIEELAARGVVAGCGGGNYCPNSPVTRAQMAIFLLRTLEGADFTPPECEGVFADVDCPSIFADWVEELFNRGVTGGCGEEPLRYCPSAANTRSQMAVFLSKTFGLTLYGP